MIRDSIRLRLAVAGGVAVLAALTLSAVGLDLLFERHVTRRAYAELLVDLDQLAAGLGRGTDGAVALPRPPSDPRFTRPLSGLYWQVETEEGMLRSRSLWDETLNLPAPPPGDGQTRGVTIAGPGGQRLLLLERGLRLREGTGETRVRTAVAMDQAELRQATRDFVGDLVPYLALLGGALMLAGTMQLAVGLRPLRTVGARVAAVRSGAARRLGAEFPEEVRPLAAEVDALICAREAEIARARARAADLAHGLRTPLQALIGEAERLRVRGETEGADGIEEIARAMGRHVDRELARARVATAGSSAACDPAQVIPRLLAVLRRTPDGERIGWELDLAADLRARIDADDLTEALGALLENAARYAVEWVRIRLGREDGWITLTILDDGPGIPPERLMDLTDRGARLDLAGPGAGLGLSIAREIIEAAGGTLVLESVAGAGLSARLSLRGAPT